MNYTLFSLTVHAISAILNTNQPSVYMEALWEETNILNKQLRKS